MEGSNTGIYGRSFHGHNRSTFCGQSSLVSSDWIAERFGVPYPRSTRHRSRADPETGLGFTYTEETFVRCTLFIFGIKFTVSGLDLRKRFSSSRSNQANDFVDGPLNAVLQRVCIEGPAMVVN